MRNGEGDVGRATDTFRKFLTLKTFTVCLRNVGSVVDGTHQIFQTLRNEKKNQYENLNNFLLFSAIHNTIGLPRTNVSLSLTLKVHVKNVKTIKEFFFSFEPKITTSISF